jgi:tRNA (cmo5U34)-methyltransferase
MGIRPLWRVPGIVLRERRHPLGRPRTPEPMVMDDPDAVAHFHAGGAANPGMQAVYDFGARALDTLLPAGGRLLDLGVGSGRALSAVLRRRPDVRVVAVDLAPNMLATAERLFRAESINAHVDLVRADITALPDEIVNARWDAISCMWTLHQLPDLQVLRAALHQIADLRRRHGAAIWISDFQRLRDPAACPSMLMCFDPDSPVLLQKDAIASEAAAFTAEELSVELADAGLGGMTSGHARPLPYLQAYWLPATAGTRNTAGRSAGSLRGSPRREAAILRHGFTARPWDQR